jgi:hypothetical protein
MDGYEQAFGQAWNITARKLKPGQKMWSEPDGQDGWTIEIVTEAEWNAKEAARVEMAKEEERIWNERAAERNKNACCNAFRNGFSCRCAMRDD